MYTTGLFSAMKKVQTFIAKKYTRATTLLPELHKEQKIIIASLILLVALVMFHNIYDSFKYTFLSYVSSPARAESKDRSLPTFIYIPSVQIALPIDETSIHYGMWEVKEEAASHLASSAVPGESNNIIIYAQNTEDQFERLTSLKQGDEVVVSTLDGKMHTYHVTSLTVVSPLEVSSLSSTDKEILTLYTSHGFGDLKRFVVTASPI